MNRKDRLERLAAWTVEQRKNGDVEAAEALEHIRFAVEEIGRLDALRDEIRELRTRVELVQYQVRMNRDK